LSQSAGTPLEEEINRLAIEWVEQNLGTEKQHKETEEPTGKNADSPLPYTVAAAAKVCRKQQRWMDRKVNKMKAAFRRPEIGDLKKELLTLDVSTNVHTISHAIPLNEKAYHPTLEMIVATHPDMKHAVELVEFQVGTSTHRHIRSWKRRLRGNIISTINNEPIKTEKDIIII
jgi:hypothetical protein